MQAGAKFGMHTMDQHLSELVKSGRITYETGLEKCHHVEDFNRLTGRSLSTLCIVHLWGALADVDALHQIAREYALHVVHDAAQCFGARYRGRPFGQTCDIGQEATPR